MPKVLMPIGDGSEVLDTFYAYYRLPEDGFEVVVAGPERRLYHTVMHEIPPNPSVPWDITREGPGYHLQADAAFSELRASDFAGAFISGGRAPEYIRYDSDLCRVVQEIARSGKPIACLCHGIEILTAADSLRGKRFTTVPKCAMDGQQGGGEYGRLGCVSNLYDQHVASMGPCSFKHGRRIEQDKIDREVRKRGA